MTILIVILNVLLLLAVAGIYFRLQKNRDSSFDIEDSVSEIRDIQEKGIRESRDDMLKNFRDNRDELSSNFSKFKEELLRRNYEQYDSNTKKLKEFEEKIELLTKSNENRIDKLNKQVDDNLKSLREENEKSLKKMQETVDEKLHVALEQRISKAFDNVSQRLEQVHIGLGEMKKLATDVDGLQKALSSVKIRGVLGEYQLENILEQMLAPGQYEKNVKINNGTVEFAVVLPGDDTGKTYIPIDSKFPTEAYNRLRKAYEENNFELVELERKELYRAVKKSAKEISEKYISPGLTTDFVILFLPLEGLYAEILRDPDLFHTVQREYRVNITGPTTLSAFLSSLQMGFRTLAIQKRSSEVWDILREVKQEFKKFGDVLEKALAQIDTAKKSIKQLVGVRARQMERKLENVEKYSEEEPKLTEGIEEDDNKLED